MKRALAAAGTAVTLIAGYGVLDVYDVVPGVLTRSSAHPDPVPLPSQTTPAPSVAAPAPGQAPAAIAKAPGAPIAPATVTAAVRKTLGAKGYLKDTAVVVRDGTNGDILFDQFGAKALIPASTTKLLGAWCVATTMDLDQPLTTKVVEHGGHIVLVAGGDTMLAPGKGNPQQVVGHAGVADLAAQVAAALKKRGRTSVTLDLDLSFAPGPMTAPSWQPDLLSMGYTARIAQLGLSTQRSDPPKAAAADPNNSVRDALVTALAAQGVTATVGTTVQSAKDAPTLGSVQSAPLIEVLGQGMRDSDNAMLESLTRAAAFKAGVPGGMTSVTNWVKAVLVKDGFDVTGVKLADMSGLSNGTTIPANLLADLVTAGATGRSKPFQEVLARESVGGWNGTLHDRYLMNGESAAGEVRAKTGSLPDVSSLAGTVVTDSGRLLVFAITTNGPMSEGAWPVRAAIDNTVAALAAL